MPLEFKQVFPNEKADNLVEALTARLQTLCRSETLKYCVYLNLFVCDLVNPLIGLNDQRILLEVFFYKMELEELFHRAHLASKNFFIPMFFHRAQLLEMIRYAALYCPDSNCHKTPVKNKKSKRWFTQAALLASEIALNRGGNHQGLKDKNEKYTREMLLKDMRLLAQIAYRRLDPARSFGRGKLMFSTYLPNEFPDFQQEFEAHTQLTLEEYFTCVSIVLSSYYDATPVQAPLTRDLFRFNSQRHLIKLKSLHEQLPHMVSLFSRYMDLESQSVNELETALWSDGEETEYSLKPMREKPILRLNEHEAVVLDPIFHIEKPMISPLFMLSKKLAKKKIRLQGHFGDAFEKYAIDILKVMYTETDGDLRFGDELNLEDNQQISDACVIDGDKLLLFEMKAVWIREDRVADPDYTRYLWELRDKYGKKDQGNAAFQLARAANRLISGEWSLKDHEMQNTKRIYPILIAYDPLLNIPGHFYFFASEFRTAFDPDTMLRGSKTLMKKLQWEVAPITIITIDLLEDLEMSVKNFNLSDLLKDYFAYCDANFRDINDDLPLPEFIRRNYESKMIRSGSYLTKALETFEESMKIIAPVASTKSVDP